MSPVRSLFFAVLFFVDVRVHAVQVESCWDKSQPCAVTAETSVRHLEASDFRLSMTRGTIVEQRAPRDLQVIAGQLLSVSQNQIQLGTPFSKFSCQGFCTAIVKRLPHAVTLQSLKGTWSIRRAGRDQEDYLLSPGLQVTVGKVDQSGAAHIEIPQSLPWQPIAESWAHLFKGTRKDFKAELAAFRKVWSQAVEEASRVHAQAAHRSLASHHEALAQAARRRKAQEDEDRALRELFRAKTYIDP